MITWEQEQERYKEAHQGMKEILDNYIASQTKATKQIIPNYKRPSKEEVNELIERFIKGETLDEGRLKKVLAGMALGAVMAVNLFAGGIKGPAPTAPIIGAEDAKNYISIVQKSETADEGCTIHTDSRTGKQYLFVAITTGTNPEAAKLAPEKANLAVKNFCKNHDIDLEKITAQTGVRGQFYGGTFLTIYELVPDAN